MGNTRSAPANLEAQQQLIDVAPLDPSAAQSTLTQSSSSSILSTAVINTDVHVRSDSVKLEAVGAGVYSLHFLFDCKVDTWVCIYFFATESLDANGLNSCYQVSPRTQINQVFNKHSPGLNLSFDNPDAVVDVSNYSEAELTGGDTPPYPFVIELKPIYSDASQSQTHTTFVTLTKERGTFEAKVIKQKFQLGSRAYEIHEMFGIQQSSNQGEDESTECVVCLTATRDTAIVPCLHMCLCMECANILRSQPNSRCPICRAAVQSLLQIQLPKA
jgi:hypothetical protein